MKTSFELPDDLYRRVKSKSALEGRAVREVATALFSAWVEGRVPDLDAGKSAATADTDGPSPSEKWLATWRELAAAVSQATPDGAGLVDQLRDDRK